jgi:hypothetical protein
MGQLDSPYLYGVFDKPPTTGTYTESTVRWSLGSLACLRNI